jgi:hypothetical protein
MKPLGEREYCDDANRNEALSLTVEGRRDEHALLAPLRR